MDKYIPFVSKDHCCKIKTDDVYYIEQKGRTIVIVTKDTIYKKYAKLKDLEKYVENQSFYHCLKGTLINFDNVEAMHSQRIHFNNGKEYALGRENYIRTRQMFANYLIKKSKKE